MKSFFRYFSVVLCLTLIVCFASACNNGGDSTSSLSAVFKPGSGEQEESSQSFGGSDQQSTGQTSQSSGETSQSSGGSVSDEPSQPVKPAVEYKDRINAYLNSAAATDAKFINDAAFAKKLADMGEYDNNAPTDSNAVYASPDGNGDGSFASPYSLQEALDSVKPGQTLYLKGGTYDSKEADGGYYITCKGNADGYITIRNYPNEKVVITNSHVGNEAYGMLIDPDSCYFILEGVEISNITSLCAYGIACWGDGQNHFVIRNTHIYNIKTNTKDPEKDTENGANGILIFGEQTGQSRAVSNVAIIGNELNDCVTGWCECLSVTSNTEYFYILENYVHDNTNIGIDFNGNLGSGKAKGTEFDQPRYSIACGNRIENSVCGYAECAGLYCDGARDILFEQNIITGSQYGIEIGSEEKVEAYPVKNIYVRNNIVANNLVTGIRIGGYEKNSTGVVYSVKIYNNTLVNNCSASFGDAEIVIAKIDGVEIVNNIVSESRNVVLCKTDFEESYTKNLSVRNNLFYIDGLDKAQYEFYMYAKTQLGAASFDGLFAANIYENPSLGDDYSPKTGSAAIDNGEDVSAGALDFYLRQRKSGKLDLGAVEAV